MMFLLRSAFWLTIVFALLPGLPDAGDKASAAKTADTTAAETHSSAAGLDPISALSAAGAAVSDAGSFCTRQPHACAIGGEVIDAIAARAEAGARFALSYVGEQIAGEKRKLAERALPRPASSTLTIEDLAPDWQGLPTATDAGAGAHRPVPSAAVPLPPKRPA